jgi:hypothetical protein
MKTTVALTTHPVSSKVGTIRRQAAELVPTSAKLVTTLEDTGCVVSATVVFIKAKEFF